VSARPPAASRQAFRIQIDPATPWGRLVRSAGALGALLLFGVVGYMAIEGWSFLDALYMTVTTVTTVGFREVEPLGRGGQIFTIIVILFGVGVALYILTTVVQTVIEGEFAEALGERRMSQMIEALDEHCILCGFGRVGEEIARELANRKVPFVIVEQNEEAIERAQTYTYLLIEGDATQDAVLEKAGIQRARTLMAASDSDAGNTYITLTAKALNPKVFVVTRVGHREGEARARRAGADRVISPYSLAGRRMALSALQPMMVDFFEVLATPRQGEQLLAELVVAGGSEIAGQPVEEAMRRCSATTLLAVQREDGTVMPGPGGSDVLQAGDRLMLLSNEQDMELLGRTKDAPQPA
jgi:voltage-gated potassium channel